MGSCNMFGLIVSGRLVQTDFIQVDTNKFLITIPNADNINHVVIFMTGVTPFADGLAGSVYFSFPDPLAPPTWQYLGFISNDKPSAIYRITKLKHAEMSVNNDNRFGFDQPIVSHVAQIGISIEPIATIAQLIADPSVTVNNNENFQQFAIKAAENLFNYCASFTTSTQQLLASGMVDNNLQFVPFSTIQQWFENFSRRLAQNPNFWR